MKRRSSQEIMAAVRPQDIFSMNADTIEQEKDEYLEEFKPQAYSTVKNFLVTQKVITLYREAMAQISYGASSNYELMLTNKASGETYEYLYEYVYDVKIGKMYVTAENVIFVIDSVNKKYYENYIKKATKIPRLNKDIWNNIQYMFPNLEDHFREENGNWIIIINKPSRQIYPLREILKFFNGRLKPEYVASILTRLYYFAVYMEITCMQHNGITIDNIFFAPGKEVAEGETFAVQDIRIVGVYGGWFFTTSSEEIIRGLSKEVFDVMPYICKQSGYSSFQVDTNSIKSLARELLGDSTGKNLKDDIPEALREWVTSTYSYKNAYEEYYAWEKVVTRSFGSHRFVPMDISID